VKAGPVPAEGKEVIVADMRHRCEGRLIMVAHTSASPSDEEWSGYARDVAAVLSRSSPEDVRTVVFTDGGGPNAEQRRMLTEIKGWNTVRVSVVSQSLAVRGIVTAFSWFNPKIKAFLPVAVEAAFRHLGLSPDEESKVWVTVKDFQETGMGHLGQLSHASDRPAAPSA
jgi:hypothetical protein